MAQPANFQAGGSFPIPTSVVTPGGAAQSVTYQNFGVSLQFVPYITDRDRIRLQLNASVSTPSTRPPRSAGQVPSQITQRQFNTTVELREGQTLTVAGLIQNNFSGTSNRVPFWGDLPIIGRTGGLDNVASGEQELVVLVTPILVHPLDMCKTPPLPGNDVFEPGDVEFYLLGHLEGRRMRGLSRVGPHRLLSPKAMVRPRRPLHHRPARLIVWLLQVRRLSLPESGTGDRRKRSGPQRRRPRRQRSFNLQPLNRG